MVSLRGKERCAWAARPTGLRRRSRLAARHRALAELVGVTGALVEVVLAYELMTRDGPGNEAYGASTALGLRARCPCLSCSPSTTIGTLSTTSRRSLPSGTPTTTGSNPSAIRTRRCGCWKSSRTSGEDVALVLASSSLSSESGRHLLERVRRLHPHAGRALLVPADVWLDQSTADAIRDAMALGRIDYYVPRPAGPFDEVFHEAISSFLLEWARDRSVVPQTVHVVGESWSGRAYELREALGQCAAPHVFCLAESESGRDLLSQGGPRREVAADGASRRVRRERPVKCRDRRAHRWSRRDGAG